MIRVFPNAIDDLVDTDINEPVIISPLMNDVFTNGLTSFDTLDNQTPMNGDLMINNDGTVTYNPDNGFVGSDTVTYFICDTSTSFPLCDTAEIIIIVNACDLTNPNIDCDNDGLTNGEETSGVDDPSTLFNPNGNTSDPSNRDTDGDGVTDGMETVGPYHQ